MKMHSATRRGLRVFAQVALVVLVILLWEYGANHHFVNTFFYSKPSAIWHYFEQWTFNTSSPMNTGKPMLQDLLATITIFGLGYLIGTAAGICIGIVIGTVPIMRDVVDPFIAFMNAMPRLALLPILIILFGFGFPSQVMLVILVIVFLVSINIATGVQETPSRLLQNAKVLGASRLDLIRTIYIPSLTIWVMSTARVTVGYAIQAAIAAEFIGAARGLGFRFTDAQARFQPSEMFAAFAVLLVLALVVDGLLALLEKRVTRWMPARA